VQTQAICRGALMVIAPAGWWPKEELRKPLSIERLAGAPVVGIAVRDTLGRQLQAYLESLSSPPKISIWVQTYQLARSLVANGHGLALVDPFTAFGGGDDSVQIRRMEPELAVSLYAVYRLGDRLHPVQKGFLDRVEE